MKKSSAQATGEANVFSSLIWNIEELDTGNFWSSGAPTRFTIPSDGQYLITAAMATGSTAYGSAVAIAKNGTVLSHTSSWADFTPNGAYPRTTTLLNLVAGDYVEARGAGVAASLTIAAGNCEFSIVRQA